MRHRHRRVKRIVQKIIPSTSGGRPLIGGGTTAVNEIVIVDQISHAEINNVGTQVGWGPWEDIEIVDEESQ